MQENNFSKIEKDLQQIGDMLMLNGTLTECQGLIHGKMGIAVFFFHYAKFTDNVLYADYAMDVISEMLDQIHANSPADYKKGLAGIGVGINYLIKNNFLSVEDDICEDFDQRMIRAVMYDPCSDFSLYNGFVGYGYYWITRLYYHKPAVQARECLLQIVTRIEDVLENISHTEQTDVFCLFNDLSRISGFEGCLNLLERCWKEWKIQSLDVVDSFPRLGGSTVANIIRAYQHDRYFENTLQDEFDIALKQIPDLDIERAPEGTGLLNGYAGEGMLRLTTLDKKIISWMHLL